MEKTRTFTFQNEILRKLIHLSSSAFPLLYYFFLTREQMLWLLVSATSGMIAGELLRRYFTFFKNLYQKYLGSVTRDYELASKWTGATFMMIGMLLTVYLFEREAAIPAILFLTIGDPAAALIGRKYGTQKYFDKSLEGSLAFYLSAAAVILILTDFSWGGLFVALAAAVIEFLPLGLDDNLLIPVLSGYLLHILI